MLAYLPGGPPPTVALNLLVEKEAAHGQALMIPVADPAGSMGTLQIDGAQMMHLEARKDGSNNLFAFAVQQINHLLHWRGVAQELDIVEWKKLDDEATRKYLSLVQSARNLERQLDAPELWPKLVLTEEECQELQQALAKVCPALRNEAFLPDWEYTAEHKLPIIPEPLGLISLSRNERRADPAATMGCAALVVLFVVLALGLLILFPPWVPGS